MNAEATSPSTATPRFRLIPIAEIDFTRGSPDLVRGLLPNRGLAVLYGASGCGKSFLALDVALHVALGRPWASQRVEQAGVVYVAAEGAVGFRRRVVAARERLTAWNAPFAMIDAAPNLGAAPGDGPELVASIRAQSLPQGWLPGLVVIDTTARVIPGLEENSAKEMGIFIANADYVAQELRCLVLMIHHSGKSLEAGMRGSSALHGAADAVWSVTVENGVRTVTLAKSKDGADNLTWAFSLEQVPIGEDDEGEPITSCIVGNISEPVFGNGSRQKRQGYPKSLKLFMSSFTTAILEHGENVRPFADGPMVRAVARDAVRDAFIQGHPADNIETRSRAFLRSAARAVEARDLMAGEVKGRPMLWQP